MAATTQVRLLVWTISIAFGMRGTCAVQWCHQEFEVATVGSVVSPSNRLGCGTDLWNAARAWHATGDQAEQADDLGFSGVEPSQNIKGNNQEKQ